MRRGCSEAYQSALSMLPSAARGSPAAASSLLKLGVRPGLRPGLGQTANLLHVLRRHRRRRVPTRDGCRSAPRQSARRSARRRAAASARSALPCRPAGCGSAGRVPLHVGRVHQVGGELFLALAVRLVAAAADALVQLGAGIAIRNEARPGQLPLRNRRRIRFLAKRSVFDKPVLGSLLRGMGHIPVDMKAGADAFGKAIGTLRSGELVGVFPEAGVSASFTVRKLKTGAVRLAAEAQVPVIPVATWGGQRLLTKHHTPLPRPVRCSGSVCVRGTDDRSATDDAHETSERLRAELQRLVESCRHTTR